MDFLIFKKMCLLRIGRRYKLFSSDMWIYLLINSLVNTQQSRKIHSNTLLYLNLLEIINRFDSVPIEDNLVVKLAPKANITLDTAQLLINCMVIKYLIGDLLLTKAISNRILSSILLNLLSKNNTIKGKSIGTSTNFLIKTKLLNIAINHRFKYLGDNPIAFLVHFNNRINCFNSHILTSIEKLTIDFLLTNNSIKSFVFYTSIKDTFSLILENIFKQSAFQSINLNSNILLNGNSNYLIIESIPIRNTTTILTRNNAILFVNTANNLISQTAFISSMTNVAILLHPAKIKDYFGIEIQHFFGKSIVDLKYKIEGEII